MAPPKKKRTKTRRRLFPPQPDDLVAVGVPCFAGSDPPMAEAGRPIDPVETDLSPAVPGRKVDVPHCEGRPTPEVSTIASLISRFRSEPPRPPGERERRMRDSFWWLPSSNTGTSPAPEPHAEPPVMEPPPTPPSFGNSLTGVVGEVEPWVSPVDGKQPAVGPHDGQPAAVVATLSPSGKVEESPVPAPTTTQYLAEERSDSQNSNNLQQLGGDEEEALNTVVASADVLVRAEATFRRARRRLRQDVTSPTRVGKLAGWPRGSTLLGVAGDSEPEERLCDQSPSVPEEGVGATSEGIVSSDSLLTRAEIAFKRARERLQLDGQEIGPSLLPAATESQGSSETSARVANEAHIDADNGANENRPPPERASVSEAGIQTAEALGYEVIPSPSGGPEESGSVASKEDAETQCYVDESESYTQTPSSPSPDGGIFAGLGARSPSSRDRASVSEAGIQTAEDMSQDMMLSPAPAPGEGSRAGSKEDAETQVLLEVSESCTQTPAGPSRYENRRIAADCDGMITPTSDSRHRSSLFVGGTPPFGKPPSPGCGRVDSEERHAVQKLVHSVVSDWFSLAAVANQTSLINEDNVGAGGEPVEGDSRKRKTEGTDMEDCESGEEEEDSGCDQCEKDPIMAALLQRKRHLETIIAQLNQARTS